MKEPASRLLAFCPHPTLHYSWTCVVSFAISQNAALQIDIGEKLGKAADFGCLFSLSTVCSAGPLSNEMLLARAGF